MTRYGPDPFVTRFARRGANGRRTMVTARRRRAKALLEELRLGLELEELAANGRTRRYATAPAFASRP